MTGLQRTGTEMDRFTVITRAVYGLVMRKEGSQSDLSNRTAQFAPLPLSDPFPLREEANSMNNQQMSHGWS
jgi:hypothetical protein